MREKQLFVGWEKRQREPLAGSGGKDSRWKHGGEEQRPGQPLPSSQLESVVVEG